MRKQINIKVSLETLEKMNNLRENFLRPYETKQEFVERAIIERVTRLSLKKKLKK